MPTPTARGTAPFPRALPARLLGLAALLLACAVAACGARESEPARVLDLARGFRPAPVATLARAWDAAEGVEPSQASEKGPFEWSGEYPLAAGTWKRLSEQKPDHWRAPLPRGAARRADLGAARLRHGDGAVARAQGPGPFAPGSFRVQGEEIVLRVRGDEPPGDAVLELTLASGASLDGTWTVTVGAHSGIGIPVWSGERETRVVDVPPQSRLVFALRHANLAGKEAALFRVRLDGEPLAEIPFTAQREHEWFSFALPSAGRAGARLDFELEGPPGLGCFALPVLAPLECGDYRARPWPEERPNVVLFVADTFRADNLASYGGVPEDTPNLNRLAQESVCFTEARATTSWTLPSLAALLTGCYPVQAGIHEMRDRLPEEIETLAQRFERAGYRTGAVTDGVFFSAGYGFHRGFGWFQARERARWSLEASLADARSFLDGDDGRPVFLVVHTYRAHVPYRTGREESHAGWRALTAGVRARAAELEGREEREALGLSDAEQSFALYREGVRALDECFGDFRALLEDSGLLARGYLVFTADHGESFGENGALMHGGCMWDTRLRVPLLVHGHDLEPRQVPWTVSNVDVAPTVAALAGLTPDPRWPGSSLLAAEAHRSVYAFYGAGLESWGAVGLPPGARFQYAVVEGSQKLLASSVEDLEQGRSDRAFDLATDRGEERDLAGTAAWAGELARRHAPRLRALVESGVQTTRAALDEHDLEMLEELGYAGED